MKGRTQSQEGYRYGFNGKEDDTDFGDRQLIQDYGFRLYNPSISKFLSVDPLTSSYPELTPFQFASNTPIQAIDLDGLEAMRFETMQNDLIIGQLKGSYTDKEVKEQYAGGALGVVAGIGTVAGIYGLLLLYETTVGYAALYPYAANEGVSTIWGLFLDEQYPLPTGGDDFARSVRSFFKNANAVGRAANKGLGTGNCQSCTATLFDLLKGGKKTFDKIKNQSVDLVEQKFGNVDDIADYFDGIGELQKRISKATLQDVESALKNNGHGSIGSITLQNKYGDQEWHILNVINDNGNIIYLDLQVDQMKQASGIAKDFFTSFQRGTKGAIDFILHKSKIHEDFEISNVKK